MNLLLLFSVFFFAFLPPSALGFDVEDTAARVREGVARRMGRTCQCRKRSGAGRVFFALKKCPLNNFSLSASYQLFSHIDAV